MGFQPTIEPLKAVAIHKPEGSRRLLAPSSQAKQRLTLGEVDASVSAATVEHRCD
jgi:hypothetical protein